MVKAFLKKCSHAKECIFCHHPATKLALQNSRFIKTNVAAKLEKGTTENKERETQEEVQAQEEGVAPNELHKEGATLEELVDAQSYITSEQVKYAEA